MLQPSRHCVMHCTVFIKVPQALLESETTGIHSTQVSYAANSAMATEATKALHSNSFCGKWKKAFHTNTQHTCKHPMKKSGDVPSEYSNSNRDAQLEDRNMSNAVSLERDKGGQGCVHACNLSQQAGAERW